MTFDKIFSDSFDTFKVFNSLDVAKANIQSISTPQSIWQILNHLIAHQKFQLCKLNDSIESPDVDESDTWIKETTVSDEELLKENIKIFHSQIAQVKLLTHQLTTETEGIDKKLKIIQDLTIHLSFHIGEIVLIMRQNGHYPMPGEMEMFLSDNQKRQHPNTALPTADICANTVVSLTYKK